MDVKDHLEFYLEHGISPVHQDITDLNRHLERRGALYRRLGVPAINFRGRSVLEVGPGSGHNSLYVASCLPAALDLVEPNPVGAREVEALYAGFAPPHTKPNLIRERLEDFVPVRRYDIAIAEAWIGATPNEKRLMQKLTCCVAPDGMMIVTLTSPISILANVLRRILGYRLVEMGAPLEARTAILAKAYGAHLATMGPMSRPHEDWVQDSLLNPAALTACLTAAPFFALVPEFTIFESFPRFAADWRWYKALHGAARRYNETYLESYEAECHNFYDWRSVLPAQKPAANRTLEADCQALVDLVIAAEAKATPPNPREVEDAARAIRGRLAPIHRPWAESIDEFLFVYRAERISPERVAAMSSLGPVFGRELLYVSMLRDA